VPGRDHEFPIDDDIVLLNHASFGVATTHMMAFAAQVRQRIEADAAALLAGSLLEEMHSELRAVADFLSAPPDCVAVTLNATEAASAVASSLCGRQPGLRVAMADTEYPSVIEAWRNATDAHGGSLQVVRLPDTTGSADDVVRAFDRQTGGWLDVVVVSLVSSPTALLLPVRRIGEWASGRGALTVVDAAHGPGHVALRIAELGATIVYGTLHKWLPVPRPLGFLYATPEVRDELRPAMIALRRDERFAERFMWRGTWDPTSALCFSAALEQWRGWRADGSLEHAEGMADLVSERLVGCGLGPTGGASLLAPRLRSFVVPEFTADELRRALDRARVRAWVGAAPTGQTLLRVATHVFTTEAHIERLVQVVSAQPGRAPAS
jgi:selenocysteine lyase/cysteine desulfurase